MLKIYEKLDDVPEGLREHYKLIEGKYVPEIATDHPILINNRKLLGEKDAAETKATDLQAQLDSAKASGLPRGHVAVPKAEAEMLEKLKPLGTVDEITVKVTEHTSLKEAEARRKREDSLALLATDLGYNPEILKRLPGLPEVESRDGKDGKREWVVNIQQEGKTVQKPASEFITTSAEVAPFLPALQAKTSVQVPTNGSGAGSQPTSQFQSARDFAKTYNESKTAGASDLNTRFGLAKSA